MRLFIGSRSAYREFDAAFDCIRADDCPGHVLLYIGSGHFLDMSEEELTHLERVIHSMRMHGAPKTHEEGR
jgi:hypothetical protein